MSEQTVPYLVEDCQDTTPLDPVLAFSIETILVDVEVERRQRDVRKVRELIDDYATLVETSHHPAELVSLTLWEVVRLVAGPGYLIEPVKPMKHIAFGEAQIRALDLVGVRPVAKTA